jgi:hypothetical protein
MFKRDKRNKDAVDGALEQLRQSSDLANQLTAKAGREVGMDVQEMMRAGKQSVAGGGQQQMLDYAARMARLTQSGVEASAVVRSVSLGEPSPLQGGVPAHLEVTVEPASGDAYDVSTDQVLHESVAHALAAGQRITVKVDPADARSVMVWGVAEGSSADAQTPDSAERLAKLERLHAQGVLTDEELTAQRAKLEAGA